MLERSTAQKRLFLHRMRDDEPHVIHSVLGLRHHPFHRVQDGDDKEQDAPAPAAREKKTSSETLRRRT